MKTKTYSFLCGAGGRHDLCEKPESLTCRCSCHDPEPKAPEEPKPDYDPDDLQRWVVVTVPCDCHDRLSDGGGTGSTSSVHYSLSKRPLAWLNGKAQHVIEYVQMPHEEP